MEREKIQSKLDLATALSQLGQGAYDKATVSFVRVGPIKSLGDWAHKVRTTAHVPLIPSFFLTDGRA